MNLNISLTKFYIKRSHTDASIHKTRKSVFYQFGSSNDHTITLIVVRFYYIYDFNFCHREDNFMMCYNIEHGIH